MLKKIIATEVSIGAFYNHLTKACQNLFKHHKNQNSLHKNTKQQKPTKKKTPFEKKREVVPYRVEVGERREIEEGLEMGLVMVTTETSLRGLPESRNKLVKSFFRLHPL